MGERRIGFRAGMARVLLHIARALLVVPIITTVILLVAGTFQVSNPAREGSMLIGLSSLSIISVGSYFVLSRTP